MEMEWRWRWGDCQRVQSSGGEEQRTPPSQLSGTYDCIDQVTFRGLIALLIVVWEIKDSIHCICLACTSPHVAHTNTCTQAQAQRQMCVCWEGFCFIIIFFSLPL
uniref:Uncharacterized protein n=1 Tax=Anguilla anguilla TaxID=7936 RepID=A0A0E9R5N2_ANGAN